MAVPSNPLATFNLSFQKIFAEVTQEPPSWKRDLTELTKATDQMTKDKTAAVKMALLSSIEQLSKHDAVFEPKIKEVLLSMLTGIDPLQAGFLKSKKTDELQAKLIEKINSVFVEQKPRTATNKGNNLKILQQIAQSQANQGPVKKGIQVMVGADEIQFLVSQPVHGKAIEMIQKLSDSIKQINESTATELSYGGETSYQALLVLLNDARGAMQTAQGIIIALSNLGDLPSKKLQNELKTLKEVLEKAVDHLNDQMSLFTGTTDSNSEPHPQLVNATDALTQSGTQAEQEKFEKTNSEFQAASERAIALVKVEGDTKRAEEALETADKTPASSPEGIVAADHAIHATSRALEQTTKALAAFTEIAAVCPQVKKTNAFLDKMRKGQQKLREQATKVIEDPALKTALENVQPEVKAKLETRKEQLAVKADEVKKADEKIDQPTISLNTFSPKQQQFINLINKTIADESKLDDHLKKNLGLLAQRALPLVKIIENKEATQSECAELAYMMLDYIKIMEYIYQSLDKAYVPDNKEAMHTLNRALKADGIHDLCSFLSHDMYAEYLTLRSKIIEQMGEEIPAEFDSKLTGIWELEDKLYPKSK